jgi:hypothetical protein
VRSTCAIAISFLAASSALAGHALAEDTRSVAIDQGFNIDVTWFDSNACDGGDGKFHFRVGEQGFEIDRDKVARGRLKTVTARQTKTGQLEATVPTNAGCPKTPLALMQAEVTPDLNDLPKYVVISETPDRTEQMSATAKYIQFLGSKGQCKTTAKPQLITCIGSRTQDGQSIPIVFAVLTQPDGRIHMPETGSPIHAKCEQIGGQLPCLVIAEMSKKTTVKGAVDLASLSADVLRARHDALVQFATTISAK